MARAFLIALLLVGIVSVRVFAHDLQREVAEGTGAVEVRLFFSDGSVFSFEAYEVYREGEDIPFQVGRTDALGRLVFIPDRAGTWRVKVFSEDGHGLDFSLATGEGGMLENAGGSSLEGYSRLLVGVCVIFGIFGLVNLFFRRRRK